MKPLTIEQQKEAIDILTRVHYDRGYRSSEIAKLLEAVAPKYYVTSIINGHILFYASETSRIGDKKLAKSFSSIEETEEFKNNCGFMDDKKYILIED